MSGSRRRPGASDLLIAAFGTSRHGDAAVGKAKAITATARKIAILVYRMLKRELLYSDPGPDAYNARQRQRAIRNLLRRAQSLGFILVKSETAA